MKKCGKSAGLMGYNGIINDYLVGGDWNMNGLFFPFSWEQSSQLTFTPFFRGVG